MVLDDFGQEVGWEAPLEEVEEVARAYARLQVTAAGHVGRLLDAGCLDRLAAQARAWELAVPLGALHQAVSYRSLAAQPPGDPHMAQSTAWWLRQVLAGLG
jgi:hypothetical protein